MQFYSTLYKHAGVLAKIASQNDFSTYIYMYVGSYVVCQNGNVYTILTHLLICTILTYNTVYVASCAFSAHKP